VIKESKGINAPHSLSLTIPHPGGRLEAVDFKDVDVGIVLTSSVSSEKKKLFPDLTLITADSLLNCQKGLSEEMKNLSIDQIDSFSRNLSPFLLFVVC
jgi:hypothetical protein